MTEPFEIYAYPCLNAGTIAVCRQPQKNAEFHQITEWEPSIVVTHTTKEEFPCLEKPLSQRFQEASFDWLHLPIIDFGAPSTKESNEWAPILRDLSNILAKGGRVLVHCKGGKGRSGMMALKLMTLQGEDGLAALARIRQKRPEAVETDAQYKWGISPL